MRTVLICCAQTNIDDCPFNLLITIARRENTAFVDSAFNQFVPLALVLVGFEPVSLRGSEGCAVSRQPVVEWMNPNRSERVSSHFLDCCQVSLGSDRGFVLQKTLGEIVSPFGGLKNKEDPEWTLSELGW